MESLNWRVDMHAINNEVRNSHIAIGGVANCDGIVIKEHTLMKIFLYS